MGRRPVIPIERAAAKPAGIRLRSALRIAGAVCALAVFVSVRAFPDALDTSAVAHARTLTLEGMTYAYNFQFSEANAKFEEASKIVPQYPRPYVARAEMSFWPVLFGEKESDYKDFLDKADIAIDNGEKFVDRYGDNADAYDCLGTIYGYRAFANGRMKSYLKAAWDGKKSYDYFIQAIKTDAHQYDAYTGLGVYHYFASFMPKALQWIVEILGVDADSRKGIRELKLAAKNGEFSKVDAQYFLAEFLPWENDDFDSSETILRGLADTYRGNALFTFTVAVWEMRRNATDSSLAALERIETPSQNAALPGLEPYVCEKLAECYFRKEEYARAREMYRKFLAMHRDELYLGTAYYRLGLCEEMLGRRDTALSAYQQSAKADRKFGDDSYCSRRAAKRIESPLGADDSLLMHAQNLEKSGRYDTAIEAYERLLREPMVGQVERSEALYGEGESEIARGDTSNARARFDEITSMHIPDEEKWLYPWSYYRSASCALTMKDTAAAKAKFEKVLNYDDYDFENWLSFRSKRMLEDIHR